MADPTIIADQVALLEGLAQCSADPATVEALNAAIVALNASLAHRPLKGRRPAWWSDRSVRDLVLASYREKTLDEVVAEATALFGAARAPTRSSVHRVWQRLDRGHLVKGVW